ncbi:MAG: hypothetical protein A3H72_02865 [Candidatus Doudnabacteria bacterium RIFCSPLOWO2_02_FULL_48_8]|uniref:Uncharacterized protein n=1 Tax=Candidatus Doudnabacteria bacterium RIFCSPHIGHO2_01_FULL_46_24 TaxID=1817825 RepID=A0A1F5NW43_9BACT|nr:MAG: hypothetical protein A2720_00170 [Candidatus Doudnabacteria bacterium RIFCSPHIGHO2_01_FULL_46_24]OGE94926.1 MAG: hypothetical protein A3H72_02865 [Candidatus Doudnabacteria bacterium RIFCSPLOWO2_02_FULL_48_8]OGE95499.1 MAG: hypothetical protein A3E98_01470 [Candidatus Doudnabacteria bacterium RIFCSPHIGHO2_12_FULL_48_11]
MDKQLIEQNREKLLAEKKRLRAILGFDSDNEGTGAYPGEYKPRFPEFGSKEDENASEMTFYETNLAVTQDMEKKLVKVDSALKRIEDGTYGKCVKGDDIEEGRLLAIPEADTCIEHS